MSPHRRPRHLRPAVLGPASQEELHAFGRGTLGEGGNARVGETDVLLEIVRDVAHPAPAALGRHGELFRVDRGGRGGLRDRVHVRPSGIGWVSELSSSFNK